MRSSFSQRSEPLLAFPLAVGVTAVVALGVGLLLSRSQQRLQIARAPDGAPGRTAQQSLFADRAVTGRTVTIARPRAEVFGFLREPRNFPKILDGVALVTVGPDGDWTWRAEGPICREFRLATRVVHEREGEILAWKSTDESDIATEGKVEFRDAPADRGTEVTAVTSWRPPAGRLGLIAATLTRTDPAIHTLRALKRMKMLLETGEIATSANTRSS